MLSPRWYHEPWAIVVLGLLCPPLALYLVATRPGVSLPARLLILSAIAALVVSLALVELFTGAGSMAAAYWHAIVRLAQARVLSETGHTAEALDLVLDAHALYPDLGVELAAAQLASKLKRRSQAAALLSPLRRDPTLGRQATLDLALLWMSDPSTFERGKHLLDEALDHGDLARDDPAALSMLGTAEIRQGDLRSAEYHLRQVVLQFRRDHYPSVYLGLATIARKQGDRKREVSFLCESLRAAWDQPDAVQLLDGAVAALHLSPAPYRAYRRALFLEEALEARGEARALWTRILDRHPDFLYADGVHYAVATSLFYYERNYRAALDHYEAVLAKFPDSESFQRAILQSGNCLEKLGRDDEAARAYRRLVEAAPAGSELERRARASLKRMRQMGRIGGLPLGLLGGNE